MTTHWKEALDNAMQSDLWLAGAGCFAHVFGIGKTGYVVKKSLEPFVVKDLQPGEKPIYERLGHHPFILQYYGEYKHNIKKSNGVPSGLVFEYISGGVLVEKLALTEYPNQRAKWPIQAAEAIRYIHSKNIIHSDIGCHNFLLKEDGTLILADFGGSMIDDEIPTVCYATRYRRPLPPGKTYDDSDTATITDDIFALGTLIYEVTVGHRLYPNLESPRIRVLINERKFPDMNALPPETQVIIQKCWEERYKTVDEVLHDLQETDALGTERSVVNAPPPHSVGLCA
ncbi:hypothetical protein LOZ61_003418 [Ophidiomyces ophidiicola]|nr:hypothetical protein LOZ61_003418 [Ophidiomyces ophidiicola]KAI1920519.1 hypothetical protein LOZ64_001835 [Ophidiomyces ophidiicola]KAI1928068.1 hypothetical protein LOZ60_002561 [Ophidiomyces ophidiicola]KAI2005578.1 hypothetical protein LOZ49_005391 [Ophidiomyces ophidiicola]KAI2007201.1 hypothetical protein LOZ50_002676 [Ophidiomyces ophidiicola]